MKKQSDFSELKNQLRRSRAPQFHFNQAEHNYKVASHLYCQSKINECEAFDWVVTVSYYCCMHYVQDVIDELGKGNSIQLNALPKETFKSFDDVVKKVRAQKGPDRIISDGMQTDRHSLLATLFRDNFPHNLNEYAVFKSLQDNAHVARYSNFLLGDEHGSERLAKQAFDDATLIRNWYLKRQTR